MIAVVSATKNEVSPLLKKISGKEYLSVNSIDFIKGSYLGTGLIVAISGVGIKRARNCTNTLIQNFSPDTIISAGYVGALNPKVQIGDLFLPEWVMSRKFNKKIVIDNEIPYVAFNYSSGGILTENSFVNSSEKKLDLFVESTADIVDMETWGIAETAVENSIRLISVNSVSDSTGCTLPRMEKIYSSDTRLDYGKVYNYFKLRPFELFYYVKFLLNMRKARISLNSFLEVLIPILGNMKKA